MSHLHLFLQHFNREGFHQLEKRKKKKGIQISSAPDVNGACARPLGWKQGGSRVARAGQSPKKNGGGETEECTKRIESIVYMCLSVSPSVCVKREKEKAERTDETRHGCSSDVAQLKRTTWAAYNGPIITVVLPTTFVAAKKHFSRPSHLVCQFWCRRCLSRAFDTATLTEWFVKKKQNKKENCEIVCQNNKRDRSLNKKQKKRHKSPSLSARLYSCC